MRGENLRGRGRNGRKRRTVMPRSVKFHTISSLVLLSVRQNQQAQVLTFLSNIKFSSLHSVANFLFTTSDFNFNFTVTHNWWLWFTFVTGGKGNVPQRVFSSGSARTPYCRGCQPPNPRELTSLFFNIFAVTNRNKPCKSLLTPSQF